MAALGGMSSVGAGRMAASLDAEAEGAVGGARADGRACCVGDVLSLGASLPWSYDL